MVFHAWRICCLLARCNTFETQLEQAKLGKRPTSIWTMKKSDLQEVAREELRCLRLDRSEKPTRLELREHVRAQHEAEKLMIDPFAKLPVGLSRITGAQLAAECAARNITLPSKVTSYQTTIAIKEQVAEAHGGSDWQVADSA